ncbi:MAG: hypothetical protein ACI92Z_002424 [Paracoccaceae bacterium]
MLSHRTDSGLRQLVFGIRNQGNSGHCVGYALANLIDIQRNLQLLRRPEAAAPNAEDLSFLPDIVSADMLYHMAAFHDRYPDLEGPAANVPSGVRTMRSAIKGFYHHGAFMDWPFPENTPDPRRWQSFGYNKTGVDTALRFCTARRRRRI